MNNANSTTERLTQTLPGNLGHGRHTTGDKQRRNYLLQQLPTAIAQQDFQLVYQPQVDTASGRLVGLEALIRWRTRDNVSIPPDEFIPLAEESGLIVAIGKWVLEQACTDLRTLQFAGFHDLHVAVNVSGVQLQQRDFDKYVTRTVQAAGLQARHIHIEITETALINNASEAAEVVTELDNAGFQIWMDDFGTGYGSLSVLRDFALSGIKIDRSFINGLATDGDDFAITSAIIAMAQRLRKGIIAEGIETEEQLLVLNQLGCDTVQGYLLGRPDTIRNIKQAWQQREVAKLATGFTLIPRTVELSSIPSV